MKPEQIAYGEMKRVHQEEKCFLVKDKFGNPEKQIGELHIIYKVAYAERELSQEESYIRCTSLSLKRRLSCHRLKAKRGSKAPIHILIKKTGAKKFWLEPIGFAYGRDNARLIEKMWIKRLGSGLNVLNPIKD